LPATLGDTGVTYKVWGVQLLFDRQVFMDAFYCLPPCPKMASNHFTEKSGRD